ncbi:MAG: stringent starvation protein [Pseudomonadota bacterium]|jgi:stringent starvation protein B|nr:stringent starvation protein [Pseudomonadota bacterium]
MSDSSMKPYLLRAVHQWCTDQGHTPYLAVAVLGDRIRVPMEYVKDNEIVLNVSYNATRDMLIENDFITFSARFNGVPQDIVVPVGNVIALFARENGMGMNFEAVIDEASPPTPPSPPDSSEDRRPKGRAKLQVVK